MTPSKTALAGAVLAFSGCGIAGVHAQAITGAGSTFAQPIYQAWADAAKPATGVTLNYNGVGSGAGQKFVTQRTVDFGASDSPMAPGKLAAARLWQFPAVIGAVDIAINVPGVADGALKLTGRVLADIYLGHVTRWNDPAIASLNTGLALPSLPIAPVYRADGSGTTFVFTSYLSEVDPDFKGKVGAATAVSWPAGTGAKGTAGVAGAVRNTPGGLGYVESAYATQNHLTTTLLQSHDGAFVRPTLASFEASAAGADWAGAKDFAVDLNDRPGAQAWPIVSATFVLVPTNPADTARGAAVRTFFDWAFAHGDAIATRLQYVALPAAVKAQVRAAWQVMAK